MDRGVLTDPLRKASTVCLVKDDNGLRVLMVQRPLTARFMPGVWVFPGGAVDAEDAAPPQVFAQQEPDPWEVAAVREVGEETGIWLTTDGISEHDVTESLFEDVAAAGLTLDTDPLIYFANWITPRVFPIRFDTRFYLAEVNAETTAKVDGDELVDYAWVEPADALAKERSGVWDVAFPTRRTLELLATASSAGDIAATLKAVGAVPPVEPRLWVSDTEARILLPDDDGFAESGPMQEDPETLGRLQAVVAAGGEIPAEFKSRT